MSEDSVAVVTRWYAALQAGDPAPELCHPEIEITNWAEFPVRGPYLGHDGVRRWWDDVSDVFEEMRWEPQSIEAIDEPESPGSRDWLPVAARGPQRRRARLKRPHNATTAPRGTRSLLPSRGVSD